MAEQSRRSKNRMVVNLRDSQGERSLSPVGGISHSEGIELKDIRDLRKRRSTPAPPKKNDFDLQLDETDVDDISSDREETSYPHDDSNLHAPRQITVISLPDSESDNETKGLSPRIKPSSGGSHKSDQAWSDTSSGKRRGAVRSGLSRKSDCASTLLDLSLSENSASPGTSRMASGASGSVEDDDLDYFCVDHMKLCSNKSIRDEHGTCENLVPAFEWAEAQRMENDRRHIESRLKRFDTFAGIMIDDRKDYKKKLELSKEDATEDFLDMMEDLIAHLLVKQREFIAGFDEAHGGHLNAINEQIRRCKKVQTETSASLKQLSELVPGSEEHHKLKRKLHDKCPVYEEILRRDFRSAVRQDYEFVPDPGTEALFADLKRLGGIRLRPVPSKLPGFLSESTETDYLKRNVKEVSRNEGRSAGDDNSCCFSGSAFLSGGQMVLTDWNNACVKMFNNKGVLINKLSLPNNPWDVKTIDDSKIVVTVPGEQKLCIVGYTKTELHIISTIDTGCECWGVALVRNAFVVISDPWGKEPSLKVFSDTGKYVALYQKDSRGKMLFRYPEHITTDPNQTTLYVSDSRSNMVTALTLGGRTLFRYIHSRLEYPAGVATDNQGNVYVCGKDSQNVHQINKEGQFVRMIFDRMDVECPRAICFEPNGENFIVTDVVAHACDDFITAKLG